MQAAKDLHITEGSSKVSGALYMAGQEHLDLLLEAYSTYSHTNPLHTDVWPSMRQLESDVIAMTASMLGGQYPEWSIHTDVVVVTACGCCPSRGVLLEFFTTWHESGCQHATQKTDCLRLCTSFLHLWRPDMFAACHADSLLLSTCQQVFWHCRSQVGLVSVHLSVCLSVCLPSCLVNV